MNEIMYKFINLSYSDREIIQNSRVYTIYNFMSISVLFNKIKNNDEIIYCIDNLLYTTLHPKDIPPNTRNALTRLYGCIDFTEFVIIYNTQIIYDELLIRMQEIFGYNFDISKYIKYIDFILLDYTYDCDYNVIIYFKYNLLQHMYEITDIYIDTKRMDKLMIRYFSYKYNSYVYVNMYINIRMMPNLNKIIEQDNIYVFEVLEYGRFWYITKSYDNLVNLDYSILTQDAKSTIIRFVAEEISNEVKEHDILVNENDHNDFIVINLDNYIYATHYII